ncbi:uroporphyrinogen-III synthase [Paenisporosarcina antarctica]|uniref:Uroporphyrinogen-III synthase n=1 Tax=Paenisporosarcina antarctica TaxID=417367 RepID=A0A4P6ZWK8_9BACL|nr:uroporphyrinogen-III synthase [Paenisporosarcina antarctica]QBP40747.1 uroporphyrinogen-III synthase [Paenisporosarcina antarctica]
MSKKGDLQGQTIVFTGHPKSPEAFLEVERLGGKVKAFPLIKTGEVSHQDDLFMNSLNSYDWLIFTSQNAVIVFEQKLARYGVIIANFKFKVAAVGSRTAHALEKIGLHVTFIPTTYSADEFVEQFKQVSSPEQSCLFLRGSLAKATIKQGLSQQVDEWTVYETLPDINNAKELSAYIAQYPNVFVAFASPSSVHIFARDIAPNTGWAKINIAAIGYVTAAALKSHGVTVHAQSSTYTWLALVQEIANWKDDSQK